MSQKGMRAQGGGVYACKGGGRGGEGLNPPHARLSRPRIGIGSPLHDRRWGSPRGARVRFPLSTVDATRAVAPPPRGCLVQPPPPEVATGACVIEPGPWANDTEDRRSPL